MAMNFDRGCQIVVLGLLPIIWLPKIGLYIALIIAVLWALWWLWRRDWLGLFTAFLVAYGYGYVIQVCLAAEQIQPHNSREPITIVQLLKQQEYQTAIAERADGSRLYLNWQSETPLYLAQSYQAQLAIKPIHGRLNYGNFNRQRWLFAQQISATATVKHAEPLPPEHTFRANWLYRVKTQTDTFLTQGLLLALAFGERAWLNAEHWQLFQQTTTAHLIAISGLHIALAYSVGFFVFRLLQWGAFHQRIRWLTSHYLPRISGFTFALGYSFLAGFSIPTVRAFIAISVLLLCQFSRRHYTPWQLWWRVVALLVVLEPLAFLSDSFWLSVLAVASLIFWYHYFPFKRFEREKRATLNSLVSQIGAKLTRLFARLLHLQVGILLIFTPIQLFFFAGSSPWALVANLVIVPLYSFILVPLILLSLLSDNLFGTWQLANFIARQSLVFLTPLSGAWIELSYGEQWSLLCLNLALISALYLWLQQCEKTYYWRTAFGLMLFGALYPITQLYLSPAVRWLTFDVGQGLAMALIYPENGKSKAIVYDTGASWRGGSMAKLEILPYFKRHGIELDTLFLSHNDNDHAGGVADLLTAYPQARFIASGNLRYAEHTPEPCEQGRSWHWQSIHIRAIAPHQTVANAKNRDSCVLVVEIFGKQLLWTGDSGRAQELQFVPQVGSIEFLQVGHHGSKSSTSETLLAQTKPQFAFISSGRWNPWKLPNQQVINRLQQHDIAIWNTAHSGMIQVDFSPHDYQISNARTRYSAWFNTP